jgi:hypothetical protein
MVILLAKMKKMKKVEKRNGRKVMNPKKKKNPKPIV